MTGGKNQRRTAKSRRTTHQRERHLSVRGNRRDPIDLPKLTRALLALRQADSEAQAQAEANAEIKAKARAKGRQKSSSSADDEETPRA